MKAILLAGGSGSRLWPISSDSLPKQFLRIGKDKSFFQQTIQRLLKVLLPKDIVVVTNAKFQSKVLSDLYELGISVPPCNVVLEPVGKNTAPAIALGIKYCMDKLNCDEEEVVLVTPSDHVIEPQERFIEYLSYAEQLAKQDCIVAFGAKPTRAETGYGYIKVSHSHEINNFVYFDVDRFVEKPNLETAERFLAEGKYYWNSGIFVFKIRTIVEEFKKHAPDIAIALNSNFESMLKNFSNMVSIRLCGYGENKECEDDTFGYLLERCWMLGFYIRTFRKGQGWQCNNGKCTYI